jgi:glucose-6-phosphate 1-dehydrogenase
MDQTPMNNSNAHSCVLTVFGGGGDLTHRKIVPAIYNLFLEGTLPESFALVGVDRLEMSDRQYRDHLRDGVDQFSRRGATSGDQWNKFAARVGYLAADFNDAQAFGRLAAILATRDKESATTPDHVFYLATSPTLIELVVRQLVRANLMTDAVRQRLVVEKPFGRDLKSAEVLNRTLTGLLKENQIYRIDHYMGKETVQNILAFRFANSIFEPIWNRRYIDHVQITVAEAVGVEHRGGYYDHSGAARDMLQSHLLRVMTLVAMEPPVSFKADEVRNKTVDVLRAIRPIAPEEVDRRAVRGQYGAGQIDGEDVVAYRTEPDVDKSSTTETYAAVKLLVDNWRWQDVPFYLRTGKRLKRRVSEIVAQFRPVPHRSFPDSAVPWWHPNRLTIGIQPDEAIVLNFQAKKPGSVMELRPVDMRFSYREAFNVPIPEAYETLLLEVMHGDATLFMRADQVEIAWAVVQPILDRWAQQAPADFPNYASGSWGPAAADALLVDDADTWHEPVTAPAAVPEKAQ